MINDHLVQPLLGKKQSRHDGPAACPAEPYKCLPLGDPPLPWGDFSQ